MCTLGGGGGPKSLVSKRYEMDIDFQGIWQTKKSIYVWGFLEHVHTYLSTENDDPFHEPSELGLETTLTWRDSEKQMLNLQMYMCKDRVHMNSPSDQEHCVTRGYSMITLQLHYFGIKICFFNSPVLYDVDTEMSYWPFF